MGRFNKLAIMGTGSLGTILGAYITKGGKDIDLIDVNKAHVDAMNQDGAKIVGFTEMTVPVHAITPDEMTETYDLVFLMIKQTYNESAFAQLKPHLHDKSVICTLQNGLPEPAVAEVFGADRVMGAPVNWGATWIGPGVSECTSMEENRNFTLGTLSGEITDDVKEVKEILELMCPVEISTNILGIRWNKLLINSTYSGMSTVIGDTFGAVLDTPNALYAATLIARECVRVAAASGVTLPEHHGVSFSDIMVFDNEEQRKEVEKNHEKRFRQAAKLVASMLQDLQKGRKCEIDAINGVVCDTGRKYGVPTPANDLVRKIVKEIEAGERKAQHANADEFLAIQI